VKERLVLPVLAELRWPILERIPIFGDFQVSPHGITIAIGFLLGAQLLLKRAQQRGVARRRVEGIDLLVQSVLTRVAIGAILGARFFYVVTRLDEFPDPLGWLRIWEGGLSLLGGIAGGIIAAVPFVLRRRLSVPLLLDSAAPGLALGIFVGRIGDLVIGEHLGGPTSFFLGWRCSGAFRDPLAPYPFPGVGPGTVQGCFDVALHQTALYDFLAGGIVFALLLVLERKPRFDGFFMAAFAVLYGLGRFMTDFARAADKDLLGPLTGSQLTALATVLAVLVYVAVARPGRRTPYAWNPPDFAHPWDDEGEPVEPDESESSEATEIAEPEPSAGGYPQPDGPP
jgi:phosphatidylglycerol:prolipoprotein diacylglycerol transferase